MLPRGRGCQPQQGKIPRKRFSSARSTHRRTAPAAPVNSKAKGAACAAPSAVVRREIRFAVQAHPVKRFEPETLYRLRTHETRRAAALSASCEEARTSHRNASPRVSLAFVRMERVRAACTTVTVACADMFLADRHIFFVGSGPFVLRAADGGVRWTCRSTMGTVRAGRRFSFDFADHRPCRHRRHNDDAKHDHKYINGSHIVIPCRLRPGCRPRCPPPLSRRRSPHRPPPRVLPSRRACG